MTDTPRLTIACMLALAGCVSITLPEPTGGDETEAEATSGPEPDMPSGDGDGDGDGGSETSDSGMQVLDLGGDGDGDGDAACDPGDAYGCDIEHVCMSQTDVIEVPAGECCPPGFVFGCCSGDFAPGTAAAHVCCDIEVDGEPTGECNLGPIGAPCDPSQWFICDIL